MATKPEVCPDRLEYISIRAEILRDSAGLTVTNDLTVRLNEIARTKNGNGVPDVSVRLDR